MPGVAINEEEGNEVMEVRIDEVKYTLKQMKNGKAPTPDDIIVGVLKCGGGTIIKIVANIFTKCLNTKAIPTSWKSANITILFIKGDAKGLKNYRPISLLSHVYKLFTKVITNRLTTTLNENQPQEQGGFRAGFSTIDHMHTLNAVFKWGSVSSGCVLRLSE